MTADGRCGGRRQPHCRCHQLSMPVPDQTTIGATGSPVCSRLIAGQEASATGVARA